MTNTRESTARGFEMRPRLSRPHPDIVVFGGLIALLVVLIAGWVYETYFGVFIGGG